LGIGAAPAQNEMSECQVKQGNASYHREATRQPEGGMDGDLACRHGRKQLQADEECKAADQGDCQGNSGGLSGVVWFD
jgi:hypothetical protein